MSMPGFPTDSPALVSPMTLRALLSYLQGHVDSGDVNPDSLVFAAVQPAYPYAYPIVDLVADPPQPDDDYPGVVYLAVGRCAGRLDPEIRRELGWAAELPRESDPADPETYTAKRDLAPPPALEPKPRKRA